MENNEKKLETTELINLMQVYLNEWIHRDEYFWIKTHKYFYATLIIILLPNLTEWIKVDLPMKITDNIFPAIGIIMSVIFIHFSIAIGKRAILASKAYRNLIKKLPKDYREESVVDGQYGKLMKMSVSIYLPVLMFSSLIVLSIILMLEGTVN